MVLIVFSEWYKTAQRKSKSKNSLPESTIAKFIENKGAGVHHVAFAIEDGVANALAEAESKEIRLIDKAPRKGAEGLNIAFLHPKSTLGVLTELCEH